MQKEKKKKIKVPVRNDPGPELQIQLLPEL